MHSRQRSFSRTCLAAIVAILGAGRAATAADEPAVIAVVGIDPYADLRGQLTWVGEQVGNPALAGFAESFILLATQGKGLAGLDVKRPVGIVITSDGGPLPAAYGFVPVKNLDAFLGAIQGVTGPVEEADGVRRISPPGAPPVEIREKDGWAIVSLQGDAVAIDDPLAAIGPLSKDYSIALELFPSRMPADMRKRLATVIDDMAQQAAAQGQAVDDAALRALLESLDSIEKLVVGMAVDTDNAEVHVDVTTVLEADSAVAEAWQDAGRAASTIASPAAADGRQPAARGHYVVNVPEAAQAAARAGFDQALGQVDDDPIVGVVGDLVRDLAAAMLDTGTIDAGFTVDTSAADGDSPVPAVTLGMKVKDGPALEKQVKDRLGKADALPPEVKVAFDAGREAGATLHEITIDTTGMPGAERLGKGVKLTLAIAPDHAYVLTGGDVKKRLAGVLAGGKPAADAAPIAGIDVSLAAIVGYVARMTKAFEPDDPQGELLGIVAEQAAERKSTQVKFSAKPADRGLTIRLSADAGALQTVAAGTSMEQSPAVPLRPARPRRLEQDDAPALAP